MLPIQPTFKEALENKPDWALDAACRPGVGPDPEIFFPTEGNRLVAREARHTCLGCAVIRECLASAVVNKEREGIWGGLSVERRRVFEEQYQQTTLSIEALRTIVRGTPKSTDRRYYRSTPDAILKA